MSNHYGSVFSHLEDKANLVIVYASAESNRANLKCVYPVSFMIGTFLTGVNPVTELLVEMGFDLEKLLEDFNKELALIDEDESVLGDISVSDSIYEAIKNAEITRMKFSDSQIRIGHIVYHLFGDDHINNVFSKNKISMKFFKEHLLQSFEKPKEAKKVKVSPGKNKKVETNSILKDFCRNFTEDAVHDVFDPIIAREKEIEQVITTLGRRGKNNPILIGDPGVGKTAIVEGLAQRIVNGLVPEKMQSYEIFGLNLGSLVAGTKYRGEFEERLDNLIKELKQREDAVLFIDETHTIVEAGASSGGSLDASNILKPALARGEIKCIGATTIDDYKKYFSKDKALVRRFQEIYVEEPSADVAKIMLSGIKYKLENHHGCIISDAAIEASVDLSVRFNPSRFLPDKAIDCLDHACSKVNYSERKDKIINIDDVALSISEQCKIPLEILKWDNNERILTVESELHKKIVNQNHVIEAVSRALRNSYSGVRDPFRPIGSFVFGGPTGTGKTYFSTILAQAVTGTKKGLIRLDMSEFSESHSISKLIGPPPGYVGFNATDVWIDKVKRNPYSVLLFDEIEKAHPDIAKLLLQVLSVGELTDSLGQTVNFKNSIIIMTGNFGMNNKEKSLGFGEKQESYEHEKSRLLKYLNVSYGEEFTNRLDEVIVFNSLDDKSLKEIAKKEISIIKERLVRKNINNISLHKSAYDSIVDKVKKDHGKNANVIKRIIVKEIEPCISMAITGINLAEDTKYNIIISYDGKKDGFKYGLRKT